MKELRLLVRLKNNRLVERREALGLTQKMMSQVIGIHHHVYANLENLQLPPVEDGAWTGDALQVAEYYGCDPGELFPEAVVAVKEPIIERRLDGAEVAPLMLSSHSERLLLPPDQSIEKREETDQLRKIVATLRPSEQEVLTRVYGLDGSEPTTPTQLAERDPTAPSNQRVNQVKGDGLAKVGNLLRKIEESGLDPGVLIQRAEARRTKKNEGLPSPDFERVTDLLDEVPGMLDTVLSAQAVACRYWEARMIARVNTHARLKLDLYVVLPTSTRVDPADVVDFLVDKAKTLPWTPEVPATIRLVVKYQDYPDDPEVPRILADARAGGFEVDGISRNNVRLALREKDPREEVLRMRLWFCDRAVLKTIAREYAVWCPAKAGKTRTREPRTLTHHQEGTP